MNIRGFFMGRAVGFIILWGIVGIVAGFYILNNYIYQEKQADDQALTQDPEGEPTFAWRYEEASSLNPDGFPETNLFLEVMYPNGVIRDKLIDTTPGSCNALPEVEEDSVTDTTNVQCYYAGLGYKFKITKGDTAYLVEKKTFEEASPDYEPPELPYEVVAEFALGE